MLKKPSLLLVPVLLLGTASYFFAQKHSSRQKAIWLAGEFANIRLDVMDKGGTLGPYEAVFVVTGPNGKGWKASAHATRFYSTVAVYFPEDFGEVEPPTGRYTWKCVVKNEVAAEGQFEYAQKGARSTATADTDWIK